MIKTNQQETDKPKPATKQASLFSHWLRVFFTEEDTPATLQTRDLQQRASWIALALILQALNEIDYHCYSPYLKQYSSLPPLLLLIGSFTALWMAIRPSQPQTLRACLNAIVPSILAPTAPGPVFFLIKEFFVRRRREKSCTKKVGGTKTQRLVLSLTFILAIIGLTQIAKTTYICFTQPVFTNDGTSLDTNAAILLLQGRNPYTDSNITDIVYRFHIQPNWTTPLRAGAFANRLDYPTKDELRTTLDYALQTGDTSAFESKVSYPALSFLILVPFIFLHDNNVLPFYLLCYLLLILLAWQWAQQPLRPWVLLLGIANVPMLASTMGGNLDIFYTLLIVLAWHTRPQRWPSALFFGLALASKQIAWYFAPFYFIMQWRHYGLKEAFYRSSIATLLGLMINLPFILWNPHAWLAGILAPVIDPMFPMGVGIINLSVTHLLPFLPEKFYTALQITALLFTLFSYWRISRTRPEAALLLAVLPLFFNWRSLPSYFYCIAYPLFALLAARPLGQANSNELSRDSLI
jgi:uncharacterized membrane protein